ESVAIACAIPSCLMLVIPMPINKRIRKLRATGPSSSTLTATAARAGKRRKARRDTSRHEPTQTARDMRPVALAGLSKTQPDREGRVAHARRARRAERRDLEPLYIRKGNRR